MPNNVNILIIDDEVDVGNFFRRLLRNSGYQVSVVLSGKEAREQINTRSFHVAVVDLKLPDANGLELLQEIKTIQPNCEVIIMTGYSTTKTAVKAIQSGAFDYIEKPFDNITEVESLIHKALEFGKKVLGDNSSQPEWLETAVKIGFEVGNTPGMLRLVSMADKIARKNINVLIHGETGTGKEVLARFVHAASNRVEQPFIAVNCGALPESLLESELFGHEKGSFTGASSQRKGIFELANKGTLFLDEVGEASLPIQVKLLRVLETGEFMRVGGEKPIKTDVRVIAATNVDLEKAVQEKTFREDLFYRLDVVRLEIPPLRERRDDIPILVKHFLQKFNNKYGDKVPQVSVDAMDLLSKYSWPGNIRELSNTIDHAMAICDGQTILPMHLSDKITSQTSKPLKQGDAAAGVSNITMHGFNNHKIAEIETHLKKILAELDNLEGIDPLEWEELRPVLQGLMSKVQNLLGLEDCKPDYPLNLQEVEAITISKALNYCEGNISMAAKALGIGRNTLYRKIKDYRVSV
ncbi:sigma-54-dependent transcriptional regulator [Desulfolucanica intricata]|uniref:sigma-54-dependent transcriptional regulator n=1 Tax=Desulfolucanica intricata TaxID=1285191 RepID=UPI0008321C78|nr:sigma-54 dependent transcriptional regulator [Desulfolucanica intricata]